METRIATEFGLDLFEVYEWPITKKIIAAHHLRAFDEAQREASEAPDVDTDPGKMPTVPDTPDVPNVPTPTRSGGKTEATSHPALRKYSKRVNVRGDGEMSQERKDEIKQKSFEKYGEWETEPRPIEGDPTDIVWRSDDESDE